jgi:hypothetical protein
MREILQSDLSVLESEAGYKLMPTPAEDRTIPLVCLLPPHRIVAQFNKVELAMVIGHDSSKCLRCKPRIVLVN